MDQTTAGPKPQSSLQSTQEDFHCQDKARQEYESQIREKVARKGYSATIPKSVPALPMLATVYKDQLPQEFAVQPKLDGYRCIASNKELRSRLNSIIRSVPQINEALTTLPDGVKLDGELYIHGVDLQTISSYVKRNSPHIHSYLIEYHVFDVVMMDTPFSERHEYLKRLCVDLLDNWMNQPQMTSLQKDRHRAKFPIKFVETTFLSDKSELSGKHRKAREEGYEGLIIRDTTGIYELNKRSKGLLKYKEFLDDEFLIVNIQEGKNGAVLVCKTGNVTTDVALAFTNLAKDAVWLKREQYIGRWAKVKYQKVLPSGRLFQPVCVEIYKKKEDAK